jgi:hypothetical protein
MSKVSRPNRIDPNQGYSIEEGAAASNCSRSWLYVLIKKGEIRVKKNGRRTTVPGSEIIKLNTLAD